MLMMCCCGLQLMQIKDCYWLRMRLRLGCYGFYLMLMMGCYWLGMILMTAAGDGDDLCW